MPEMVTKYPDVALKILQDANIACAKNNQPKILKTCPKKNFCSLPTGELCIYGLRDMTKMTQINSFDLFFQPGLLLPFFAFIIMIFLLGMWLGTKLR